MSELKMVRLALALAASALQGSRLALGTHSSLQSSSAQMPLMAWEECVKLVQTHIGEIGLKWGNLDAQIASDFKSNPPAI